MSKTGLSPNLNYAGIINDNVVGEDELICVEKSAARCIASLEKWLLDFRTSREGVIPNKFNFTFRITLVDVVER